MVPLVVREMGDCEFMWDPLGGRDLLLAADRGGLSEPSGPSPSAWEVSVSVESGRVMGK